MRKNKELKKIIISVSLVLAVFLSAAVISFAIQGGHQISQATQDRAEITKETQTNIAKEPKTTSATSALTETEVVTTMASLPEQPEELSSLLSQIGKSVEDLTALNCTQLVSVDSIGTEAEIKLWECSANAWAEVESMSTYGFVGQMGAVDNMSEDISGTPRGLYPVGSGFYRYEAPATGLDLFQITDDTYWVDDPDSAYYNQRVEGTENKDWDSAEHMADYTSYNYGFVVNYNMPAVYNAGSAIFFHIGSSPTAGCIATDEATVKEYLQALDKECQPYILIN